MLCKCWASLFQTVARPGSTWNKQPMIDWLKARNIPVDPNMLKPEVYELIRKHRPPPVYVTIHLASSVMTVTIYLLTQSNILCRFAIDKIAEEAGHRILRLPPYHCEYNPIENIWGQMKSYFDAHVGVETDFSEDAMLNTWLSAIAKVTPADWARTVERVDLMIHQAWEQEVAKDVDRTDYSQFRFTVNDEDEDDNLEEIEDDEWDDENDEDYINRPPPSVEQYDLADIMETLLGEPCQSQPDVAPQKSSKRKLNFQVNLAYSALSVQLQQCHLHVACSFNVNSCLHAGCRCSGPHQ